jgi:Tfp pilus assembly protein PilE
VIPGFSLVKLAIAAAVLAVMTAAYFGWRGQQREIGRQEVRAELAAAMKAQTERNRELQRAAEKQYTVQAGVRDRYIVKTITEVRHATESLAACPVPAAAVGLLNDAADCARGDSPSACGTGEPVRKP